MSVIRDKVEKKIREAGYKCPECDGTGTRYSGYVGSPCYKCAGKGAVVDAGVILSVPELAIVDREAELPKIHYGSYLSVKGGDKEIEGFELGLRRMREEGWVKEIKV